MTRRLGSWSAVTLATLAALACAACRQEAPRPAPAPTEAAPATAGEAKTVAITGWVVDKLGTRVARADVDADDPAVPQQWRRTRSGDDGSFRIDGLAPGRRRLCVRPPYLDGDASIEVEAPAAEVRAVVDPRRCATARFRLPPTCSYPADVRVYVVGFKGGRTYSVDGPDAAVAIEVARGKRRLHLYSDRCVDKLVDCDIGDGTSCDLGVVELEQAYDVTVFVHDESGAAIPDAQAWSRPSADGWQRDKVQPGSITLFGLPAGDVTVHVTAPRFSPYVVRTRAGPGALPSVATLVPGALLHGRIVRPGAGRAPWCTVSLVETSHPDDPAYATEVWVKGDDEFMVWLAPGRYRVSGVGDPSEVDVVLGTTAELALTLPR